MKLTSDVKQRKQRSQHNFPKPNNSYKAKKKFTSSYTEGNPYFRILEPKTKGKKSFDTRFESRRDRNIYSKAQVKIM